MFFKSHQFFRNKFSTLIIAEHNKNQLLKGISKVLNAVQKLNQQTHLLVVGHQLDNVIKNSKSLPSNYLKKIIAADNVNLKNNLVQNYEFIINQLITKYNYKNVVGLSSSLSKDILPRIAANYDSQPISDIIEIVDENTFIRPAYAGNALSKVKSNDKIKFLTFRASSFEQSKGDTQSIQVQNFDTSTIPKETKAEFIKQQLSTSNKPQLTSARIVVSGGRGVKSKENFQIIQQLANAFGDAAIGASRAAVDAGYCPNQLQVGQTGKVVAPELYLAIGISGAVQHLAGMKDSKVIVAINNRAQQPIFEVSNYGLIGDLFKVVPQLTEKIKKLK